MRISEDISNLFDISKFNKNSISILLLIFVISLLLNVETNAQTTNKVYNNLNGSRFNNRVLGYPNDATSPAFNPALLGLRDQTELVLVLPYTTHTTDSLNTTSEVWGGFFKISALSIGYLSGNDISPSEIYLGLGFSLYDRKIFFGASGTVLKYKGQDLDFGNTRMNISVLYVPVQWFMTSFGGNTMHTNSKNDFVYYNHTILSPFDWLSLHLDAKYSDNLVFINEKSGFKDVSLNTGLSFSLDDDLSLSTMYNLSTENLRLGIEYGLGVGFGVFADTKTPKEVTNSYDFLLRFSGDDYLSHSDLAETGSLVTLKDGCLDGGYFWQAFDNTLNNIETHNKLKTLGGEFSDLANELTVLAPNPNDIFNQITKKYYPNNYIPTDDSKLTLDKIIKTKNNDNVYLEKTEKLNEREISSIIKVKDGNNRNISGLKKDNFGLLDSNYLISKVQETTSENKVPVDIVFIVDASASMSTYIASIKRNIESFANQLQVRGVDTRLGGILFGNTILKKVELTADLNKFKSEIAYFNYDNNAYAECTSIAINEAAGMDFRVNADKLLVVVTDECMLQNSAHYTENDIIRLLWSKGVKLFGMVNFQSHNAGYISKFTLGKDYNITSPFNEILDNIAGDVSTTYEVVYSPIPKEIPKVIPKYTAITGEVVDEEGWKIATEIKFISNTGKEIKVKTNGISGQYLTLINEGEIYDANINQVKYKPLTESINLINTPKGDTITKNFVLTKPKSTLSGVVYDENNMPISALVTIKNKENNEVVFSSNTNEKGEYSTDIKTGQYYVLTAKKDDYINFPVETEIKYSDIGENFKQDLKIIEIIASIEQGLTFRIKNILFDTGKWDIKPESATEINKIVEFMNEYPKLKLEIGAHTDDVGKDEANMSLSSNRANSVVQYIISKGVNTERLTSKGYGETTPVGDNTTPEGRTINRRVEFKLIK